MRKHWDNVLTALGMMISVLGCIILFVLPFAAAQQPSRVERIEQGIQEIREAQAADSKFDTSWIENNLGAGEDEGTIRMIGATVYVREGNLLTLEDEQGQQWLMDNVAIEDTDNVLLWIADNNTALDYTDDAIIKVFVEVCK